MKKDRYRQVRNVPSWVEARELDKMKFGLMKKEKVNWLSKQAQGGFKIDCLYCRNPAEFLGAINEVVYADPATR